MKKEIKKKTTNIKTKVAVNKVSTAKKKSILLPEDEKSIKQFEKQFRQVYNNCTTVLKDAVTFVENTVMSGSPSQYYKGNVIVDDNGVDRLEEYSRNVFKTVTEFFDKLPTILKVSNLSNSVSEKEEKIKLFEKASDYILRYKLDYAKCKYLGSNGKLYRVIGSIEYLAVYYEAHNQKSMSDMLNTAKFNITNLDNTISRFINTTLDNADQCLAIVSMSNINLDK